MRETIEAMDSEAAGTRKTRSEADDKGNRCAHPETAQITETLARCGIESCPPTHRPMSNTSRKIVDKAQNFARVLFFDACPAQEIANDLQAALERFSATTAELK